MSENEIDYEAENKKLAEQLEKANGESARRKRELGELRTELESLKSESPTKLKEELDTLKGELRTIRHKEGFQSLLADKEVGLNKKVTIDRLIKLMDYRAEGDFNLETVREQVLALKETDPYLFTSKQPDEEPAVSQSPWGGRGVSVPETTKAIKLTESQMRDPVFMAQFYKSQSK